MIPLNQLIPECLLALGAAFLLGNLAAYVRLRPAWREANDARGGRRGKAATKPEGRSQPDGAAVRADGARSAPPARRAARRDEAARSREPSPAGDGSAGRPRERTSADAKAAARPRSGRPGRVNARVRQSAPATSLPSRARVLMNVMIGFLVTVAALAALIRG